MDKIPLLKDDRKESNAVSNASLKPACISPEQLYLQYSQESCVCMGFYRMTNDKYEIRRLSF